MSIRLTTLGSISVRLNGEEFSGLASRKRSVALLSYLALEGPVLRDRLVAVLWPRVELEKARHSLAQAVYLVRKELGEDSIQTVAENVALTAATAMVDARELEEAAAAGDWPAVAELYSGPFLEGLYLDDSPEFDDWQSRTRTRLLGLARRGFRHTVETLENEGNLELAIDHAVRWVDADPLADDAQYRLISLLAQSGNRSAALNQFEAYREKLDTELDVEPLEPTLKLVERIRSGETQDEKAEAGPFLRRRPSNGESPSARKQPPESLQDQLAVDFGPRLQIISLLGQGSMANVFLAREPELDRLVAVKVFAPGLVRDRRARRRFEREAKTIASLTHRNIVTLYWADTLSNGLPFIVMQHVKGRTLSDRLAAVGRLSAAEARLAIISLASALEAAHKEGILHRDVHPGNLLYEEDTGRYLLSDFGFASLIAKGAIGTPARITESGELIGQPGYRSPEQLMETELTELSDVYGTGLVAYEVLAGRPPYDPESNKDLLRTTDRGITPITELRPDVDPGWDELVARCLSPEPQHRPNAGDIVRAARAFGDKDEPGHVSEPSSWVTRLAARRVPHYLAAYLAGGLGVLELINQLVERGHVSELLYHLVLATYVTWFPAAAISAWFHGRRGRQPIRKLEWWIYGGVAVLWLAASAVIIAAAGGG